MERIELNFKDWWDGKFQYGIIPNEYLSKEEFEKIKSKQIELFDFEVQKSTENKSTNFLKKLDGSQNPTRLIETEIETIEKLLFPERCDISNSSLKNLNYDLGNFELTIIDIETIRKLYQQQMVYGEIDYKDIPSPNAQFSIGSHRNHYLSQIQAQSFGLYYNFLKAIKATFDSKYNKIDLFSKILKSCQELQGRTFMIAENENSRNSFIAYNLKNYGVIAYDQTLLGKSASGKNSGEIDIKVEDSKNDLVTICECLNLKSFLKKNIIYHIDKVFNYDLNGLPENYLIVYYIGKGFQRFCKNYFPNLNKLKLKFPIFSFTNLSNENINISEIMIGESSHVRSGKKVKLKHIIINIAK